MDVNLCRLPDENRIMPKFPVPLAGFMWHPLLTDGTTILSKQAKRQFIIKKNGPLRTVGISHQKNQIYIEFHKTFYSKILFSHRNPRILIFKQRPNVKIPSSNTRRGEIISVTYAFFFAKRVLNTNHSSVAIQIEE